MQVFVCHSNLDSEFVIQVASLLKPSFDNVFYFEAQQKPDESFNITIDENLKASDYFLVFVGSKFSKWQLTEVGIAAKIDRLNVCTVFLRQPNDSYPAEPHGLGVFTGHPQIQADPYAENAALYTAWRIATQCWRIQFHSPDGLPFDPNLFSYEKDIIAFFANMNRLGEQAFLPPGAPDTENNYTESAEEQVLRQEIQEKLLNGCPTEWPRVTYWANRDAPEPSDASYVVAAALTTHHLPTETACMIMHKLFFPEARTRQEFYLPTDFNATLGVAILVAGGIAPGINAVIDGIVQRHWWDAVNRHYNVLIYGIKNGISAIDLEKGVARIPDEALVALAPSVDARKDFTAGHHQWEYSAVHAREGGSIIGTSRADELIKNRALLSKVVDALLSRGIEILYVIGGDGSMKLAHALWHCANVNPSDQRTERKLSVVAIPKTMDNDILWVWQSFGFLSAVEKAREILAILDTEIKSNPRLCILQLFGSDSGFVVSHTVAASGSDQCDAALIPEVKFSLYGLADYLRERMCERKRITPSAIVPSGFVVMAETAIPTDAICYVDDAGRIPGDLLSDRNFIQKQIGLDDKYLAAVSKKINLSLEEKEAIYEFHRLRRSGQRIQGQTSDTLRSAGLKIVSRGLQELMALPGAIRNRYNQPHWGKLRIVTNEPRHVLRSIAPTCSDIIMGQRLGTLAVDNAMVGYTDFMISQWLTEFVLVPLPLVVLGRKRIPTQGLFWQSVLAKTRQPSDLDNVGSLPGTMEPEA